MDGLDGRAGFEAVAALRGEAGIREDGDAARDFFAATKLETKDLPRLARGLRGGASQRGQGGGGGNKERKEFRGHVAWGGD